MTDTPNVPAVVAGRKTPRFVTGSMRGHILEMTLLGAVGLMAVFVGDLANMLFLSLLRDVEIIAAVGYASSIVFLTTSVGIGLSIATTALVSPALGARKRPRARRLAASGLALTLLVAAVTSAFVWLSIPSMLAALGATGRTAALATSYLHIIVPSIVPLAAGMTLAGVLRSLGDARRAMHVTLVGAAVNVALDPLLIFGAGLGIEGAAIASSLARLAVFAVGLHGASRIHDLIGPVSLPTAFADAPRFLAIAVPAVLTNIATPAANAYVTAAIAPFGDEAVAGWAMIGRIVPVAFGAIYALSGTIGPILGQNLGARDFVRVRDGITQALLVTAAFTAAAWLLLALAVDPLIGLFAAHGLAAELMRLFCRWLAPLFVFLGALFVANAAMNVLGKPHLATVFNWGRATLGTVPFVLLGGKLAGAQGALAGNLVGAIPFGIAAAWMSYRIVARMAAGEPAST